MRKILSEITKHQVKEIVMSFFFKNIKEKYHADFLKRGFDVFFSDGYNHPDNRVIFFCLKGSPNKYFGYVQTMNQHLMIVSNKGKFYADDTHFWQNRQFAKTKNAQEIIKLD